MTSFESAIETRLPIDEAFAYIADFANSMHWDPGVATTERVDAGPVGVGSRYRLGVRMGGRVAPMEYRIAVFEPPRRVVLAGEGSGVTAVDEIRFVPAGDGTRVDYTADIRLGGLPRARPAIPRAARSRSWPANAVDGMQRDPRERAAARRGRGDRP